MTWARKWGQSTPKVRAISSICPPPPPGWARRRRGVMVAPSKGIGTARVLADEEQRVEDDRLGEGDGQDRLDEDLRGRPGVASHGVGSLHADEADGDGGAECRETNVEVADHSVLACLSLRGPSVNRARPPCLPPRAGRSAA